MPVIELINVYKRFHGQLALDNVSFSVERGEIFGIVGPNGSGKTLLMECIAGRATPDQGAVAVLGLDPQRDQAALRRRVAMQMPVSALPDAITAWEALDLYSCLHGQPADWHPVLDLLGLAGASQCRPAPLTSGSATVWRTSEMAGWSSATMRTGSFHTPATNPGHSMNTLDSTDRRATRAITSY